MEEKNINDYHIKMYAYENNYVISFSYHFYSKMAWHKFETLDEAKKCYSVILKLIENREFSFEEICLRSGIR